MADGAVLREISNLEDRIKINFHFTASNQKHKIKARGGRLDERGRDERCGFVAV